MKRLAALILILACVLTLAGCARTETGALDDVDNGDYAKAGEYNVVYNTISADWPVYENAEELVKASSLVLVGYVKDIAFQVLDDRTALPPSEETEEWNRSLNTIYAIDIIALYKGEASETINMRMRGGQKDIRVEEQLEALGEDATKGISIMEGMPSIEIGETYVFSLYQYEDTMPTLINVSQGVYEIDDPQAKDQYSFISPKDIIMYFGEEKWAAFQDLNKF